MVLYCLKDLLLRYVILWVLMCCFSTTIFGNKNQNFIQKLNIADDISNIYQKRKQLNLPSQKNYIKKTISFPESPYLYQQFSSVPNFNEYIGIQILREHLNLARFFLRTPSVENREKYHVLLSENHQISSKKLKEILEQSYANEMVKLLKQNQSLQKQSLQLVQNQNQTFATTKGKSDGITATELQTIMQTSFFFMPYITNAYLDIKTTSFIQDGKKVTDITKKYVIDGGMLIYQLKVSPDFSTNFNLIKDLKSSGITKSISKESKEKKISNNSFFSILLSFFDLFKMLRSHNNLTNEQLHTYSWNSFSKKLTNQLLKMTEFELKSNIAPVDLDAYELYLGEEEGLYLNQYFSLMEHIEKQGVVKTKQSGLLMIDRVGKNKNNYNFTSRGVLRYGEPYQLSNWVVEKNRKNVQLSLGFSYLSDLSIYQKENMSTDTIQLNRSSGAVYYNISKNIARYVNISQLFFVLDGHIDEMLTDFHFGIQKKYWYRNKNLNTKISLGMGYSSAEEVRKRLSYSTKLSLGYEHLIRPEISLNTVIFYNMHLFNDTAEGNQSINYSGIRYSAKVYF